MYVIFSGFEELFDVPVAGDIAGAVFCIGAVVWYGYAAWTDD